MAKRRVKQGYVGRPCAFRGCKRRTFISTLGWTVLCRKHNEEWITLMTKWRSVG